MLTQTEGLAQIIDYFINGIDPKETLRRSCQIYCTVSLPSRMTRPTTSSG